MFFWVGGKARCAGARLGKAVRGLGTRSAKFWVGGSARWVRGEVSLGLARYGHEECTLRSEVRRDSGRLAGAVFAQESQGHEKCNQGQWRGKLRWASQGSDRHGMSVRNARFWVGGMASNGQQGWATLCQGREKRVNICL